MNGVWTIPRAFSGRRTGFIDTYIICILTRRLSILVAIIKAFLNFIFQKLPGDLLEELRPKAAGDITFSCKYFINWFIIL
jgi:hypothetical protein